MDYKKELFKIIKPTDNKLANEVELAIKYGKLMLVENVGNILNSEFDPILTPVFKMRGKNKMIKLGEKEVEFNEEFKLYFTTNHPNPRYTPETCVKVTLINFSVTKFGLIDQMLSLVISIEKYELESEKKSLVEQSTQNEKQLKEYEDEILETLKNTESEKILDDDDLINKLKITNEESARIKNDQKLAFVRDKEIIHEREK